MNGFHSPPDVPWEDERTSATTGEPIVRMGNKISVHCPECQHLGTHTPACSWSQARSGQVWVFYAEAISLALPDPSHVEVRG